MGDLRQMRRQGSGVLGRGSCRRAVIFSSTMEYTANNGGMRRANKKV